MFLEIQFDSGTKRFWTGNTDITTLSQTWSATADVAEWPEIPETTERAARGLTVTLSGANNNLIDEAINNDYQNRIAKIYLASLSGGSLDSDPELWYQGKIQEMNVEEGGLLIDVQIDPPTINFSRPPGRMYADADQKDEFSGDTFFEFTGNYEDKTIQIRDRSLVEQMGIGERNRVYGRRRVKNKISYYDVSNDTFKRWVIMPLADHQIKDLKKVWVTDQLVWENGSVTSEFSGDATVVWEDGTSGQSANSTITGDTDRGSDFRGRGVAYVAVRMSNLTKSMVDPAPVTMTAEIEGYNKVRDVRDSTDKFTANGALVIRDYLLDSTWGLDTPSGLIDDNNFARQANVCDSTISTATGGTRARYEIHADIKAGEDRKDVLDKMLSAVNGKLIFSGGKYKLRVGKNYGANESLKSEGQKNDDIVEDSIRIKGALDKNKTANIAVGSFPWSENDYNREDFLVRNQTAVSNDNSEENRIELNLNYVTSLHQARDIATGRLARLRNRYEVDLEAKNSALKNMAGENVKLTYDFGARNTSWTDKKFQILDYRTILEGGALVKMRLRDVPDDEFIFSVIDDDKDKTQPDDQKVGGKGGSRAELRTWNKEARLKPKSIAREQKTIPDGGEFIVVEMGIKDVEDGTDANLKVQVFDEDNDSVLLETTSNQERGQAQVNASGSDREIDFRIVNNEDVGGKTFDASGYIVFLEKNS